MDQQLTATTMSGREISIDITKVLGVCENRTLPEEGFEKPIPTVVQLQDLTVIALRTPGGEVLGEAQELVGRLGLDPWRWYSEEEHGVFPKKPYREVIR